jgi:formylglycine-generating enzyme required for sulfatase activity
LSSIFVAIGTVGNADQYLVTRIGQIRLKRIPAGTFRMGSYDGEGEQQEHPQHAVRISRPFYLGVYEVTQSEYQAVMGQNPSHFSRTGAGNDKVAGQSTDQLPVESVTWLDAVRFCNALSYREGLRPFYEIYSDNVRVPDWNGTGYRLPTEAEWEYACRADSTTRYCFGEDANVLDEYAWYTANSGSQTHPIGKMKPNAFGLYDMHGNVWEWCWDGFDADYYERSPANDPRGPERAASRVIRGGSWLNDPYLPRSAYRFWELPESQRTYLGFRLARAQSGR